MILPVAVSTATRHERSEYHDTKVTFGTVPATYGSIAVVAAAGHCSNGRRVVVGGGAVVVVLEGLVTVEGDAIVVEGTAVVDTDELVANPAISVVDVVVAGCSTVEVDPGVASCAAPPLHAPTITTRASVATRVR